MSINWDRITDIAVRAVKTGVQTTMSVALASQSGILSADTWETAAAAALAAALSVVQNAISRTEEDIGARREL